MRVPSKAVTTFFLIEWSKIALTGAVDDVMARAERTQMTQDRIIDELSKIALAPVSGEVTQRDRLRALHLLGQHHGLFVTRSNVNLSGQLDVGSMTDEEIRARLLELAREEAAKQSA